MSDTWVVNASPLILLGKIGEIALIGRLTSRLIVPEGVAQEIQIGAAGDPARAWINGPGAKTVAPVAQVDPLVAAWDLGLGESHVLTLCRSLPDAEAILDDRAARNCAAAFDVRVRGTLSIVVLAKRRGEIAAVKPLLDRLLAQGIRVDAAVVEAALRMAGEL